MDKIIIKDEFIKLGQALKLAGAVDSGVDLPADGGVGLIDSTRPKLPFTTLEEANDYAGKVGLALFDTIEAANNWINTGNRATLL